MENFVKPASLLKQVWQGMLERKPARAIAQDEAITFAHAMPGKAIASRRLDLVVAWGLVASALLHAATK